VNRNQVNFLPLRSSGEFSSLALLNQGCESIEDRHSEIQRRSIKSEKDEEMMFSPSQKESPDLTSRSVGNTSAKNSETMTGLKPKVLIFESPSPSGKKKSITKVELVSPASKEIKLAIGSTLAYSSARTADTGRGSGGHSDK
jgi:hypothetical protein